MDSQGKSQGNQTNNQGCPVGKSPNINTVDVQEGTLKAQRSYTV